MREQIKHARAHIDDAFRRDVMLERVVVDDCLDTMEKAADVVDAVRHFVETGGIGYEKDKTFDEVRDALKNLDAV